MSLKNTIRALVEDKPGMSVKQSLIGNGDPLFTLKAAIDHIRKCNFKLTPNAKRRMAYWQKLVLPPMPVEIVARMPGKMALNRYRYWVTSFYWENEIKLYIKNKYELWEAIKSQQLVYRQERLN